MPTLNRKPLKFVCKGLNISLAPDLLPDGYFPFLNNVNANQLGEIETRPGSQKFYSGFPSFVHSIRRLNDEIPTSTAKSLLVIGAGTQLFAGTNPITGNFSGNPLSLIPYRPDQSPEPWMYIADSTQMGKIRSDQLFQRIGIFPPSQAPSAEFAQPLFKSIDLSGGFTAGGTAGSMGSNQRPAASTVIAEILYDAGATGWCCIVPSNPAQSYGWLQPGEAIIFNGFETAIVQEVQTPITATTIQTIAYDTGTTGLCSVVLGGQTPGLERNSVIVLNGSEYVRVLSVTSGPNGTLSFRCSTVSHFSAGASVGGLVSFRAYSTSGRTPGDTLTGVYRAFQVTVGTGIQTAALAVDLSQINGRAVQVDDYIHISFTIDNEPNLIEGRFELDVDATTNDFTRNYYYKAFRASDLTPAYTGQLTAPITTQTIVSNIVYDNADPRASSEQIGTGALQYSELRFPISELVRIGADGTRTLANVAKIRFMISCSATVNVTFDSFWVAGTYGPDVPINSPTGIYYRYRYRSSVTGARSNPSPATRYQLFPSREAINVTCTSSGESSVDLIDIERYDPNLQSDATNGVATYVTIATIPNNAPTFQDQAVSAIVAANPPLEIDRYQPWPVLSTPLSGTCNVSGTNLQWVSGDQFPLNLQPGTVITIGSPGQSSAYQTYTFPPATASPPLPSTKLQLQTSAGSGNSVPFTISSPILIGEPLAIMFGPLEGPEASFMFALGDPLNPGTLYWTNGNDPDSTSDKNYIEITSPSEALIGGVVWNSLVYVFSRERVFILRPSFDANGNFQFTFYAIPSNSGLWSNWALCAGYDGVYFLGRDGIYRIAGEESSCITDESLYPLFPHQGIPGVGSVGNTDYPPVDMTQFKFLRMSFTEGDIYFNYVDTSGTHYAFRFDTTLKGWFPQSYPSLPTYQYWEETPEDVIPQLLLLTNSGKVLVVGGTADENGTDTPFPVTGQIRTPSFDSGDSRSQKLYVDLMTDMVGTMTAVIGFNNNTVKLPTIGAAAGLTRTQVTNNISDIGTLTLYRNICAEYRFNAGTRLYEFEPSFYAEPYLATSFIARGDQGFSDWQLARDGAFALISNGDVTLQIDIDGRFYSYTLRSTNGNLRKVYVQFAHGSKGRMFIWQLTSGLGAPFAFFADETMVRIKDWAGDLQEVRPFAVMGGAA